MHQLQSAPQHCLALLNSAEPDALQHMPLEDYTPVAGCPLSNVVRVQRTGVRFSAPFTLTCPVAVSWLMFERQRLQPLAAASSPSAPLLAATFITAKTPAVVSTLARQPSISPALLPKVACGSASSRTGIIKAQQTSQHSCMTYMTPPVIISALSSGRTTMPRMPIISTSTTVTLVTVADRFAKLTAGELDQSVAVATIVSADA